MRLYTYFRSSSSFRVRIALNLKGIEYEPQFIHLVKGEQKDEGYLQKNPQGIIPTLEDGDVVITQSMAIIEYLEETTPNPPLLPKKAEDRAHVRAMVGLIACEMQPLNNIGILKYLKVELGMDQAGVDDWYRHWIARGFTALEALVDKYGGKYCCGDNISIADVFLIPQMWNARRFDADLSPYANLEKLEEKLYAVEAFDKARPENQPDNPDNA